MAPARHPRLSSEAAPQLRAHTWPGTGRELEHTVQRALILASGDAIAAVDNVLSTTGARSHALEPATTDIKTLERDHILSTLKEVGGSRKLAVQRLGISERTLRYKLQQYRLEGIL
jgi:two-component system response regulator FlrC